MRKSVVLDGDICRKSVFLRVSKYRKSVVRYA